MYVLYIPQLRICHEDLALCYVNIIIVENPRAPHYVNPPPPLHRGPTTVPDYPGPRAPESEGLAGAPAPPARSKQCSFTRKEVPH